MLAADLGINYCTKFFEKNGVNGKVLLHFSKEEFVSMLRSTGDKCLHRSSALRCSQIYLCHAGVYNAQALTAWDELEPFIKKSKLTHANKRVSALCIVL